MPETNVIDITQPVRLSEEGLSYIRAKIDKLNARSNGAVGVIAVPVQYTWVKLVARDGKTEGPYLKSPEEVCRLHDATVSYEIAGHAAWFDVQVTLNAPKIDGYTLVARVEHLTEGNLIHRVPGCTLPVPTSYRTGAPVCRHCMTTRRRNDTFVLHETERDAYTQIGRNCLADFLRTPDAAQRLLDFASVCQSLDNEFKTAVSMHSNGSGGRWYWKFDKVIALAAAFLHAHGGRWTSAAQARDGGGMSSARQILDQCCQAEGRQQVWFKDVAAMADAMLADPASEANACVQWLLTDVANRPEDATTDYENNLVVLAKSGMVHSGQFALAASGIRAYQRQTGLARAAAEAAKAVIGGWVGTVGERSEVLGVTCTEIKSRGMGEYGEQFLIKFTTPAGDELVWFTGEGTKFDPEVGKSYNVKFGVKEHSQYRNRRNTIITRVNEFTPKPPKTPKARKPRAKKGSADDANHTTVPEAAQTA